MLAFEQKRASTSVHVIIQMLLILKCYGVNKHSLLTTSYFFDESSTGYQRNQEFENYCGFFYGQ